MADGFNFQPYIQPYVTPPIQEFNALGETLNQRYEQNVANMTELDLLANQIQVLPTSQRIKDQMLADVNRTLTQIRENGDIENAAPRIREAVRRFATDPNLRQAAENYKRAEQFDEEVRQLRLQGKNPYIFQDYRNETFDENGRLNPITSDNQARLDYSARYKTFFDQLQPETFSAEETGWRRGPGGVYEQYGVATQRGGITRQRIENIANERLNEYLNTDEGIQEMKALTSSRYGNLSPEEARQQIRQNLIGAGMERVFQSQSTSSSAKPIDNPYLDLEYQQLRNAKARMEMQASQGNGVGLMDMMEVYKTETKPLGFQGDVSKYMTNMSSSNPEESARTEATFKNNLRTIAQGKGKAASDAKSWLNFMTLAEKMFPNSYRQVLSSLEATKGKWTDNFQKENVMYGIEPIRNLLNSTNPKQKEDAEKFVDLYMKLDKQTRSKQFLWRGEESWNLNKDYERTPLEKEMAKIEPTYQIDFVKPNTLLLPSEMRTAWNSWSEKNQNSADYKMLVGDEDKFEKAGNNLTLNGVTYGRYSIGDGVAVELSDKEGNTYVAVPNAGSKVANMAKFLNSPQLALVSKLSREPQSVKEMVMAAASVANNPEATPQARNTANANLGLITDTILESMNRRGDERTIRKLATPLGNAKINPQELINLIDKFSTSYE